MPRLRPSPATVLACLALAVSLGGTAYAASTINGSLLVDHSVTGRKLAANTLGGAQIDEARLGLVPNAAHAGGQRVIGVHRSIAKGTAEKALLSISGIGLLRYSCDAGGTAGLHFTNTTSHSVDVAVNDFLGGYSGGPWGSGGGASWFHGGSGDTILLQAGSGTGAAGRTLELVVSDYPSSTGCRFSVDGFGSIPVTIAP